MVQSESCPMTWARSGGVAEHSSVMSMVLVSSYIREWKGPGLPWERRVNAALSAASSRRIEINSP